MPVHLDVNKRSVGDSGGIELLFDTLSRHMDSADTADAVCGALKIIASGCGNVDRFPVPLQSYSSSFRCFT
jgi:hypothetical protein